MARRFDLEGTESESVEGFAGVDDMEGQYDTSQVWATETPRGIELSQPLDQDAIRRVVFLEVYLFSAKTVEMLRMCVAWRGRSWVWVSMVAWFLSVACAAPPIPSPDQAARDYARAVEKGDEDALWGMMSERAKQSISKEELAVLLAENSDELRQRAALLQEKNLSVSARAVIELDRGDELELTLRDSAFWITHDQLIPSSSDTPLRAVEQLRLALSMRDYRRLMMVLAPELREELDESLAVLEEALADLDHALLDINNDRATVTLPGGTEIHLRRDDDQWLISEIP